MSKPLTFAMAYSSRRGNLPFVRPVFYLQTNDGYIIMRGFSSFASADREAVKRGICTIGKLDLNKYADVLECRGDITK